MQNEIPDCEIPEYEYNPEMRNIFVLQLFRRGINQRTISNYLGISRARMNVLIKSLLTKAEIDEIYLTYHDPRQPKPEEEDNSDAM